MLILGSLSSIGQQKLPHCFFPSLSPPQGLYMVVGLPCRTMCADHFSTMALPVAEFLALEHGTEYSGVRAGKDDDDESMVSTQ